MAGAVTHKAGSPLSRYLDTTGDGTGDHDGNGNYSETPRVLRIVPGPAETFLLGRLTISIVDTQPIDADSYGNGLTLTNGIAVRLLRAGEVVVDLTNSHPVKKNSGWTVLGSASTVENFGSGNDHYVVRWDFSEAGQRILLSGSKQESLEVVLQDDLSGLLEHLFHVQGIRYP